MTLPNGAGGINIPDGLASILFPTSGPSEGNSLALSGRYGLTQSLVEAALKQTYVLDNPSVKAPLESIFEDFDVPEGTPLALAILTVLARKLLNAPAAVWGSITGVLSAIQPWVESIPGLGDIVEWITGIPDSDPNDAASVLAGFFSRLRSFFAGIDFNDPDFDLDAVRQAFTEAVVQPFIKTISQIRAALLGAISIGQLTDERQTLLLEGGFDDLITVVENGDGVTHDATDGVPGSVPLGCARIVLDGTTKRRATEVIQVGPGWVLEASARFKTESVSGAVVALNILPYSSESTPTGAVIEVATSGALSGSSGGTGGWGATGISGSWTVPSSGVTHIALEWTAAGASGVVKLDNVDLLSTEKIPQAFTKDLPEDLASLLNFLRTWVESALTGLGITPSGVLLDDIFDLSDEIEWIQSKAQEAGDDAAQALANLAGFLSDEWQALLNGVKGATGGAIADIINRLANITSGGLFDAAKLSAVSGAAPQSAVAGLVDLNSLTAQIRDILAGVPTVPTLPIIQDIKDWFTGLGGKVQNLTSGGTLPPTSVGGVGGAPNIGAAVQDTVDDLVDGWNKFWDGIFRTNGSTGKTAQDVQTAAESISNAVLVAQESTITLANLANAPKNVPYWVSNNPFEDVSFPRSQLQPVLWITSPTNSGGSGDAAHSHSLNTGNYSSLTLDANLFTLTAVRTTQDRIYNSVGFIANGATPPATVLMGLYRIDPATGAATLEYDFGNVSSAIPSGAGLADFRANTTYDIIAAEGDLWGVGLLPIGGTLGVGYCQKSTIANLSGVYPSFATGIISGTSALPSTVADAAFSDMARRVWACVGQAVPEDTSPITFVETFNVADNSNWTSPSWNVFKSITSGSILGSPAATQIRAGISNGRFTASLDSWIPEFEAWVSIFNKRSLNTFGQASEITIGSGWDTQTYGNETTRAYVRCRNNGVGGVAMHLDNNGTNATRLRIATITNATEVGTVRITVTGLAANVGDRFRIECTDGNVYTCYRNDVAIPGATWTDSGNVVPQTKPFRAVGCGVGKRRTSYAGSVYDTAMIDHWTGYDLGA